MHQWVCACPTHARCQSEMFPKLQLIFLLSETRSLDVVLASDLPFAKLAAPLRTGLPVEDPALLIHEVRMFPEGDYWLYQGVLIVSKCCSLGRQPVK